MTSHPTSPVSAPRTSGGRPRTDPGTAERSTRYTGAVGADRLTLRTLALPEDAVTIHAWTRGERARFWGMRDHDVETVCAIYTHLDASPDHTAHLWWWNDRPCCLVQTYAPAAEAVGSTYEVQPGDLGAHFLVAPIADRPRHLVELLIEHSLRWSFQDPSVARIVVEPDEANHRAIARMRRAGFVCGPVVDLPDKRAQLAFLTRQRWADLYRG